MVSKQCQHDNLVNTLKVFIILVGSNPCRPLLAFQVMKMHSSLLIEDMYVCHRQMTSCGCTGLELELKCTYIYSRTVICDLMTFDGLLTC